MSQITRTRLARGTKLTTQHVHNPLTAAATALSGRVDDTQMARPNGVFRVTLPFPLLAEGILSGATATEEAEVGVSFPLPPPQDVFNTVGRVTSTTPIALLESVALSWDQRDESCSILGELAVPPPAADVPGNMDFGVVLGMRVRLTRKRMRVFDATASFVPEAEVLRIEIPALAVASAVLRQNPICLPVGNKPLDPYSTYTLWITAMPPAGGTLAGRCIPSFVASLRCRYPLGPRDVHTTPLPIRNMPTQHLGAQSAATVTVGVPLGNASISAEAVPNGLHTNLTIIDRALLGGLQGGYSANGEVGPNEHVQDDACYEVIAVPLHGGTGPRRTANITGLPFLGAFPYVQAVADRRIIPLPYPMVLHHVVALEDWSNSSALATPKPNLASYVTHVGVGLGTGLRGDRYGYQQLAYFQWLGTDATRRLVSIDLIKHQLGGTQSDGDYDQALYQIPLVYPAAGPDGVGYPNGFTPNGRPIYCGRATNATSARTQIPAGIGGALGASAIAGEEQFVEVRWLFQDAAVGLGGHAVNTTFIGGAGHWVFLYCRKHLTGER